MDLCREYQSLTDSLSVKEETCCMYLCHTFDSIERRACQLIPFARDEHLVVDGLQRGNSFKVCTGMIE